VIRYLTNWLLKGSQLTNKVARRLANYLQGTESPKEIR
jgi:hypothetical protein